MACIDPRLFCDARGWGSRDVIKPCGCSWCTAQRRRYNSRLSRVKAFCKIPGKVAANLKHFGFFFGVQFLSYGLITWNYRVIALANYWNIAASDLIFAAMSYKILQKVAKAEGNWSWAGYTLGGVVGSLTSTWITKHYLG